MNTFGIEQHNPSIYRDRESTSSAGHADASYKTSSTAEQAPGKQTSGAQEHDEMSIGSILTFAKDIQAKTKEFPYLVPAMIGGAAFALGVLASSRILRQLVLMAGGYAVKYAIQNAPKDEMLSFAKKVMTDSFRAANAA
jgi:hypothetical protein